MINQEKFELTLDDVLHEILLAAETAENPFSPVELRRWTTRFPQFEREIAEFFVTEIELEALPERELSPAFEEKFAVRSSEILATILKPNRPAAPIKSLKDAAAARNLRFSDLVRQTGMSSQLLTSLEQRSVIAASIPAKVIKKISEVLQISAESLTAYFAQPQQFLTGTSYKAADQPILSEQKDFADLVAADLQLTAEQKQELLD